MKYEVLERSLSSGFIEKSLLKIWRRVHVLELKGGVGITRRPSLAFVCFSVVYVPRICLSKVSYTLGSAMRIPSARVILHLVDIYHVLFFFFGTRLVADSSCNYVRAGIISRESKPFEACKWNGYPQRAVESAVERRR